jgi:hypothetical protein
METENLLFICSYMAKKNYWSAEMILWRLFQAYNCGVESKRISNQADDVRETTHLHHCREESPLVNIRFDNGTGPIKS